MRDFHNEKLKMLAKRSNAEQMDSVSSFAQGFIMGRKYEKEFNTQLHNNILREMHEKSEFKFEQNNWWDNRICELEKEIDKLREEIDELKDEFIWDNP